MDNCKIGPFYRNELLLNIFYILLKIITLLIIILFIISISKSIVLFIKKEKKENKLFNVLGIVKFFIMFIGFISFRVFFSEMLRYLMLINGQDNCNRCITDYPALCIVNDEGINVCSGDADCSIKNYLFIPAIITIIVSIIIIILIRKKQKKLKEVCKK